MKWGNNALFAFGVVAGAIYEFIYEPIQAVISNCLRIIVTVTAGTWRRFKGAATELPSKTA
ncbi:MAG: hypothetical protein JSW38_03155 [Dehalococcoidia bacterium]|nr:MAG: hypothetical protein JSW38_03155 [Dehalococcoidia bacterium]